MGSQQLSPDTATLLQLAVSRPMSWSYIRRCIKTILKIRDDTDNIKFLEDKSNIPDCETAESSSEGKAVLQNVKVNTKEMVGGQEFDNVRYRLDCHSCLLVEIGERANYLGLPCDTCGRKPRSPYGYF